MMTPAFPISAPPGFVAPDNLMTSAATAPAAATTSLNLEKINKLATQEKWECVFTNRMDSVASFCVERGGETIRVNVFYDVAIVGIMFGHPRMGQTSSFCSNVNLSELQKIFRNPRVHTGHGYSNIKKQKSPNHESYQNNNLAIGDNVHLKEYPKHSPAIVEAGPRYPGDMVKIHSADGSAYRVHTHQLSQLDRRLPSECKSLGAEAELQLKRLNHELERILKEKKQCEHILRQYGGRILKETKKQQCKQILQRRGVDGVNMNHSLTVPQVPVPSPRTVIGAFEPYIPNKGSIPGSIWYDGVLNQGISAYLGNGVHPSAASQPPFFPNIDQMGHY